MMTRPDSLTIDQMIAGCEVRATFYQQIADKLGRLEALCTVLSERANAVEADRDRLQTCWDAANRKAATFQEALLQIARFNGTVPAPVDRARNALKAWGVSYE